MKSSTQHCVALFHKKSKFKFFTPQNVLSNKHYRLKIYQSSEYQPVPPALESATGAMAIVIHFTLSPLTLLYTEELMRRALLTALSQIHCWLPSWSISRGTNGIELFKNRS